MFHWTDFVPTHWRWRIVALIKPIWTLAAIRCPERDRISISTRMLQTVDCIGWELTLSDIDVTGQVHSQYHFYCDKFSQMYWAADLLLDLFPIWMQLKNSFRISFNKWIYLCFNNQRGRATVIYATVASPFFANVRSASSASAFMD